MPIISRGGKMKVPPEIFFIIFVFPKFFFENFFLQVWKIFSKKLFGGTFILPPGEIMDI